MVSFLHNYFEFCLNFFIIQPRGKKKFIDKKNAVTFRLVHRSQQDPLVADENAPQRVLQPIESKSKVIVFLNSFI